MQPAFFDNRATILKDDLVREMRAGSVVSVAASVFSMYAYRELAEQLEGVRDFRFIFTSPAFLAERAQKDSASSTFRVFPVSAAWVAPSSRFALKTS